MKTTFIAGVVATTALFMLTAGIFAPKVAADDDDFPRFFPDTLVLSRSVYVGTASTVTIGETLPRGCAGGPNGSTVVQVPTTTAGTTTSVTVPCGVASDNGESPNLKDSHNVWNNSTPMEVLASVHRSFWTA